MTIAVDLGRKATKQTKQTNQDFVFVLTSCIICMEFHMTFPVSIMDYFYDTVWSMTAC